MSLLKTVEHDMSIISASNEEKQKKALSRKLYQLIIRWHFFCGLLFIPLTIIISISGIVYLFEDEYEEYVFDDLLFVKPGAEVLPASTLISIAKKELPNQRASGFKYFDQPTRSAQVVLRSGTNKPHHGKPEVTSMEWAGDGPEKVKMVMNQSRSTVYINPYTGKVLGTNKNGDTLMSFMKDLHGNLLGGKFGSLFVELTSSWIMMLMATGILMWWPRGKVGIRGTLIPRLSESKRIFWRDLHAIPAFYFSFLIIFLIVSGLPWTEVWGTAFHTVQRDLNMSAPAGFHSRSVKSTLDKNSASHQHPISIDHVISSAKEKGYYGEIKVKIPRSPTDTFAILQDSDDPAERASMHFDQYSGKILAESEWSKIPVMAKAVTYGIKLHRGEYFGVWNLVLVLITTLILVFMCVSGIVLWLKRRPKGKLGEPKRPKRYTEPAWLIWTTVGFAAFMPLLGASLLLFILADWCYSKTTFKQKIA